MKYKEIHEKYDIGRAQITPYCRGLSKGELPGNKIHEAALGDFMCDYINHLNGVSDNIEDYKKTADLMRCLLNTNIKFKPDGNAVVRWIGPELLSLCE